LAGGVHHVTAKTPSGRVLLTDSHDGEHYLQLLAREIQEREWSLLTFCLMTNHVHLLVRTPRPDLGLGIKRAHEDFARHINKRHDQNGHVFGSRFYNGLVQTDRHLLGCLRYIARNPAEAGACSHPRDWRWSAHRALAGLEAPPPFLDVAAAYEVLGSNEEDARTAYLHLVARSNAALLADIARPDSDAWLLAAVDDFSIPLAEIAAFLGRTDSAVYRRIAKARATEGTVPSVANATGGTVPGVALAEG
jgi:REP element-mobilizing transposase RayT